jgi:hypothetical protein
MTQRNVYSCRFAPNRFGIPFVVGFVSPDAVGLGAQAGLALNLVASLQTAYAS